MNAEVHVAKIAILVEIRQYDTQKAVFVFNQINFLTRFLPIAIKIAYLCIWHRFCSKMPDKILRDGNWGTTNIHSSRFLSPLPGVLPTEY